MISNNLDENPACNRGAGKWFSKIKEGGDDI
jgi:hypothetical protein